MHCTSFARCLAAAFCAVAVSPLAARGDALLAPVHEGLSVLTVGGAFTLLGEDLPLVEQQPGSLKNAFDGAIGLQLPLSSASFQFEPAPSLVVPPLPQAMKPGIGGAPGEAPAALGGWLDLEGTRQLPEIPLPDGLGAFPESTLLEARFDVALRDLVLALESPAAIPVDAGVFDARQAAGALSGFADLNGHVALGFDGLIDYLTAAAMLQTLRAAYPDVLTSVDGNLGRRQVDLTVQTRLDLAGRTLENATTEPGGYALVGLGPRISLPMLASAQETLVEGLAGVSLEMAGLALAPAPGDASGDGSIDLNDFGILKSNFGRPANRAGADFDSSGDVTLADFAILKAQFAKPRFGRATAAVPEPGGSALALASLVWLTWLRRRTPAA
jgi:hypothetical protein